MDRNTKSPLKDNTTDRSLSARRAWIEISRYLNTFVPAGSLSARRAWIEILASGINPDQSGVALRKESVDRNLKRLKIMKNRRVALRKESVDRN